MCIYLVKVPAKLKPIGKMWMTTGKAHKAATRAAKRYGHADIHHWKNGRVATVFPDGEFVRR